MTPEELAKMEDEIVEELIAVISELSEDDGMTSNVSQLQPTTATIKAMATAAAQVLMAFERGYQMDN